jgi:beta-galactosidase
MCNRTNNRLFNLRVGTAGIFLLLFVALISNSSAQVFPRRDLRFTDNWKFNLTSAMDSSSLAPAASAFNDASWTTVCLPHTAHVESAISHGSWDYWKGVYWYRKSFTPDASFQGKKVFLEVEAGMQTTQVWVNGNSKLTYGGGYNPFTIDITGDLLFGQTNVIAMRLNNAASTNFSPGAEHRDFYYYGGLYRHVNLHVTDSLHITDAVYANIIGGGGVFVTYPAASASSATVQVQTHVLNESTTARTCVLTTAILDSNGSVVQTASTTQSIAAGASYSFTQSLVVSNPRLWSPMAPNLYTVRSQVYDNTRAADQVYTTIGIRRITFSRTTGLQINGVKLYSVGADHHQDYGAIGCAVPVSGQYRDALRLKEAGINFVRLSHYLQNGAFLDACDKLGITVQASLVGWQWDTGYSKPTFVNNLKRDLHTMIHYYRNHPCVVMWESIMNESQPQSITGGQAFVDSAQAIAHAEYPGDQMFTCGQETSHDLDIWQAATQQNGRTSQGNSKPQAITEFGHWDYGGFNYGGTSSNQPRAIGEAGMLQLGSNQADAMNQDHALSWLSVDALWVYNEYFGFDQYHNSLCGGGIVDDFRIPKFNYYFFQSQRDTTLLKIPGVVVNSGPMVYIANFWTTSSPRSVRVYSNCSQVSLYRNGTLVATQSPDNTYPNIPHNPFTFTVSTWTATDSLRANGLINGVVRATHLVRAPGTATCVSLKLDTATMPLKADGADLALAYASIVDVNGTVVPTATNAVTFTVSGPGTIISGDGNPTAAVAGIATVYVQTQYNTPGTIIVTASASGLSCTGSDTVTSVPASTNIYTAVLTPAVVAAGKLLQGVHLVQHGALISISVSADMAGTTSKAMFRLYNIQGRLIRSWAIKAGAKTSVTIADCARGMYFGRLTVNGREYGMRVVAMRP